MFYAWSDAWTRCLVVAAVDGLAFVGGSWMSSGLVIPVDGVLVDVVVVLVGPVVCPVAISSRSPLVSSPP